MPTPGEHKSVQARILAYAETIGWTIVSRQDAEQRRGFDPDVPSADRAINRTLFFDDLLDAQNQTRKQVQAEKGFDGLTFFVYRTLVDATVNNP